MAVNAEWLHFAQVIILSLSVYLSNLVSLDAQVQKRRVTTDFTFTPYPWWVTVFSSWMIFCRCLCKCKCIFHNLYTISIISTIFSVCVKLFYLRRFFIYIQQSLSNQYKLTLGLANIQYPLLLSSPHKQKVTQRDWKMLCQPFLDWV